MPSRRLLTALLLLPALAACVSLPKLPRSAKADRMADACAVAALAVGDLIKDGHGDLAAITRSPLLLSVPAAYRIPGGVEQPLDLRACPGVATVALGGGMTLWGPSARPPADAHYLSHPTFDRDGTRAIVTWSGSDARLHGIAYEAVRTPLGWRLKDEAASEWAPANQP
jgi:hypothetical protein